MLRVVLNAWVTKTTAAEILANPATRRRQVTMTISLAFGCGRLPDQETSVSAAHPPTSFVVTGTRRSPIATIHDAASAPTMATLAFAQPGRGAVSSAYWIASCPSRLRRTSPNCGLSQRANLLHSWANCVGHPSGWSDPLSGHTPPRANLSREGPDAGRAHISRQRDGRMVERGLRRRRQQERIESDALAPGRPAWRSRQATGAVRYHRRRSAPASASPSRGPGNGILWAETGGRFQPQNAAGRNHRNSGRLVRRVAVCEPNSGRSPETASVCMYCMVADAVCRNRSRAVQARARRRKFPGMPKGSNRSRGAKGRRVGRCGTCLKVVKI